MEKASKSILSGAEYVAERDRRNGLAMFLNKMAETLCGVISISIKCYENDE